MLAHESLDYGAQIVAGVTPGKGGAAIHGVPVYDSLCQALREHPATRTIPIIIHTAVPLDQITAIRVREMGRRLRYDGFIEFPIDASELNTIIDSALERGKGGVEKWTPPRV